MEDVDRVVRGTVALTTREMVHRFDTFNREKGLVMN